MILFKEKNHIYENIDSKDTSRWTSVTKLVEHFSEPFDEIAMSEKSSRNKKSKWFGMKPEDIRMYWKNESDRSIVTGNWYHKQREDDVVGLDTITRDNVLLPIIKPIIKDDIKYAPEQKLSNGIYPEHLIYLKSAMLCGQSDRVEVINNVIDIYDYKSNKEITTQGFKKWDGSVTKMLHVCKHLDECKLNHYALQLSTYMYMMLRHNPQMKPGVLMINHVIFEKESEDRFGYPILRQDADGNYIIKEVIDYKIPYLKNEVKNMIEYYNNKIKK